MSVASVDHPTAIASSEFKYGAAVKPSLSRERSFTPIGGSKSVSNRQVSSKKLEEVFCCCSGAYLLKSSEKSGTCSICGVFCFFEVSKNAQFGGNSFCGRLLLADLRRQFAKATFASKLKSRLPAL